MAKETTQFADKNGREIFLGDRVRIPTTINKNAHGEWGDYRVIKRPGGYVLSYLISEKGQVLPVGFSGGYMTDTAFEDGDLNLKTLVYKADLPMQHEHFEVIEE